MGFLDQLPEQAVLLEYFNYGVIAIVAFFAIIGFFRGTYKSLFYMIATAVIIVGGWFIMDTASNFILTYDLTSYNLTLLETPVTNIREFVTNLALNFYPGIAGLLNQDTYVASLVSGLMTMVVRLVYFIVLIVLSFTVLKFLTDILWMFFKPKKRDSMGKKRKKSFLSRLGGFGIGAVKGALYLLLLMFPIAGLVSVSESLSQVVHNDQDDGRYELVLLGNSATLLAEEEPSNPLGELTKVFDLLGIYRDSYAGQVFGSVKIGETAIDEYVFDSLLSFNIDETKIALREELQIVANALSKLEVPAGEELSLETVMAMDPDQLRTFVDDISELEILKVVIPIALEVVILYEDAEGNSLLDQVGEGIEISLEDIHSADYSTDIQNLGYIFVDVTQIYDFTEGATNNLLASDPLVVQDIFNSIGELGIVDLVAPIGVSYLTTMPEITTALDKYGITMDDLGLSDIEDWGTEIAKFGPIYDKFHAFQIDNLEAFQGENPDYATLLQYVTEESVNEFTAALFDSLILSNATPVIMGTLIDTILPEEYRTILSFDAVTWDATEFGALLNASVTLIKSGLINMQGGTPDLAGLTEDDINELAHFLSQSDAITTNLNNLIEMLLTSIEGLGDMDVEFVMLEDEEWTEAELQSLLNAARVLATADLTNLGTIEDATIDDIALYLSGSKFIRINLNPIIEFLLGSADLFVDQEIAFVYIEADDWTEAELLSLFHAAKLLMTTDFTNFGTIEDTTIDNMALYLSGSKFITSNLNPILDVFLGDMALFGEEPIEFVELNSTDWTQAEIGNLFHAAKLLSSTDFTNFGNIEDTTIDDMALYLSGSKFITSNLNPILDVFLDDMALFGEEPIEFVELASTDWTQAEIGNLFHAAKLLSSTDFTNFDLVSDDTIANLATYLSGSKFITLNLNPILDVFLDDMALFGEEPIDFVELNSTDWTQAEIGNLFHAAKLLSSTDFTNFDLVSDDTIASLATYLSGSKFITLNLNPILDVFLDDMALFGEEPIDFVELDSSDWTEDEISNLFHAAKLLSSTDFTNFETVENATIDDMATYLSGSKFITLNLNPILDVFLDDMALFGEEPIDFVELDSTEWTYNEIFNLFHAAKLLSSTDFANFETVENATIDDMATYLSGSKFITLNLNPILDVFLDDMALFGEEPIDFVELDSADWTEDEISNLFHAAKLLSSTDFTNFETVEDATIDDMAFYLSGSKFITYNLNPILDVFLDDMALFGETEIAFIDLQPEEWTETEISSLFYAAKLLSTTDFSNFGAVTDTTIDALALHMSNSKFIKNSLNPILDVYLDDMALFGDAQITFIELQPEEWTQLELSSLLHAAKLLSTTDFAAFETVEDTTIDALALHMSNSKFIKNSLNPILDVYLDDMALFGDAQITFIELQPEEWTELELSSLLHATKLLASTDFTNFGAVSDATILSLAEHISSSKFITYSLNPILDVYLDDMGIFGNSEIDFIELDPEEWTENELTHLFFSAKLLSTNDMANMGALADEDIEEMSYHMANSLFITRNLNPLLDSFLEDMDTGTMTLEFGQVDDWSDPIAAEVELIAIFQSAKIISSKGNNTDAFLNLTESELDTFLSSELISETLVNLLKSLSQDGNELDFLVGVDDPSVPWYDGALVDTVHSIDGTIMTITAPLNTNKFNIYADGVKVAATRNLTYDLSLIVLDNPTPVWSVKAYDEGELRKVFTAMGALATSLGGAGGFTTDSITALSDADIDNIIVSDILVQSIVVLMEDMAAEPEPFIVIPEGDLKSADSAVKLAAWKNSGDNGITVEGELAKLFKGLRRFLQGNTIESFDMTTITGLTDEDIYEMLKSEVLSESIIVQIEAQADPLDPASIIVIPEGVGLDNSADRSAWNNVYELDEYGRYVYDGLGHIQVTTDGELTKCLRALKIILDGGSLENIDIGNILDETNQDIVLNSIVIESTIIKKIEDEAAKEGAILTIPQDIQADENLWKGETGELRNLLHALDYILGDGGTIEGFTLDLNVVLAEKDEILKSLVISETIITKIDGQDQIYIPTGSAYALNNPANRSAWRNTYLKDDDGAYVYDLFDNVVITSYGELSRLLDAVEIIVPADPITGQRNLDNITFDVGELVAPANRNTFLGSLVISETIVQKIFETANGNTNLYIPGSLYLNTLDDATASNRNLWFNQTMGEDVVYGELYYLLDAIDLILGDGQTFDNIQFDVGLAFDPDNQNILLRSKVISETMVQKIVAENNNPSSMLALPGTQFINDITTSDNRDKWFNEYIDGVVTKHELAYLLDATSLLVEGSNFTNLNFNLSAAFNPANQVIILHSAIISETILQRIVDETENESSMLVLPPSGFLDDPTSTDRGTWFNEYNADGSLKATHELAHVLNATNILLAGGSFENVSFNLNAAFNPVNQATILRSYIISETILQRIVEETNNAGSMLQLPPTTYLEDPTSALRSTWYNQYDAGGNVTDTNELAHVLDATNILLDGGSFENVSFNLSLAFDEDNQPIILRSFIISETILQRIVDETNNPASMLVLPPDGFLDEIVSSDRGTWYNTYNEDGDVTDKNELAYLLNATNILLGGGSFDDVSFNLSLAFNPVNQPIILRSTIISETILQRIVDETNNPASMLVLPPDGFLDDIASTDRGTWYNTYDNNDAVTDTNELAHLLNATNLLLDGGSFDNVAFDLSTAFDSTNQATILRSYIISETILQRIVEETEQPTPPLYLAPTPYLDDVTTATRTTWYNAYDNDGTLTAKKELANLLNACKIILGDNDFDTLTTFDISVAFDATNQAILLKSYVIAETFVQSIYQESVSGNFDMPSATYLENPSLVTTRSTWYNQYNAEGEVTQTNEIAHLLNAAKELVPVGGNFTGMDFSIENLFDETKQAKILKSYIFAETIISKIYEQNGLSVNVPIYDLDGNTLADTSNRTPWFNQYVGESVVPNSYGEIAHMLTASKTIIGDSGQGFDEMAFNINFLFDPVKQDTVLRSLVLQETIVQKILAETDTIGIPPAVDLQNRPLTNANNRLAWYSDYRNDPVIVTNELVKFLSSIELVVGEGSFETMGALDVDTILALDFTLTHNAEFYATESDFETLVNSVVMENIIADLVEDIASTVMVDYLTVPADGYHFYKKELITNFDPATFNEDLYDLQGFMESLYVMNQSGIDYNNLDDANILSFDENTSQTFAKSMVISRVFKGSIEEMYNSLLYPTYTSMADTIPVSLMPLIVYNKKAWDDVRFYQTDYDDETRLEAYTALLVKLTSLQEVTTVNEIPIPTAFYEQ